MFLIKRCFCVWLDWLFPPESPLRTDSSIWLDVPSLPIAGSDGLKLVTSVSAVLADCFSDRGTANSNVIITIILDLWSHQSLWQPSRPPTSVPACKASLEKLNWYFWPFTHRYYHTMLAFTRTVPDVLICFLSQNILKGSSKCRGEESVEYWIYFSEQWDNFKKCLWFYI